MRKKMKALISLLSSVVPVRCIVVVRMQVPSHTHPALSTFHLHLSPHLPHLLFSLMIHNLLPISLLIKHPDS